MFEQMNDMRMKRNHQFEIKNNRNELKETDQQRNERKNR